MKKFLFFICSGFVLSACQASLLEEKSPFEDGEMIVVAVLPGATKATSSSFEVGDKIGLFVTEYSDPSTPSPLQISGNWANNIACTFDGNNWISSKKIFWAEGKMDVYGFYPYMSLISVDDQPFDIALDQNVPETDGKLSAYEASDVLYAKSTGVSSGDDEARVTLRFRHIMSRLVIKLVKGEDYTGDFPEDGVMCIHNVVPQALVDLKLGEVVKDPYGESEVIRARMIDNSTFEAIIVPQRLDTRRPFLEYIAGGVSYLYEDTFNFRTGVSYTVNLTINSNPDQIAIEIGGETENW